MKNLCIQKYTISHSLGQIANEISVHGEKTEAMMRAVMEYARKLDVYLEVRYLF